MLLKYSRKISFLEYRKKRSVFYFKIDIVIILNMAGAIMSTIVMELG